jgi:hypothetical protein
VYLASMETKFKTSFIPKQENITTATRHADDFRLSILSIIAIVLFIASVGLSVWVFLYQRSLVTSINRMNAELIGLRNSFEPAFIDSLIRLDSRIESSKKILASHNSLNHVLALLEEQTLEDVRFETMEYVYEGGKMSISMTGEARNFLTVASQSDLWSGERRIVNPIFNNLDLDDRRFAQFNFKSPLETSLFLYKNVYKTSPAETVSEEMEIKAPENDSAIIITPPLPTGGVLPGF